ncbi:fibronectin type III domain protein [Cooperia oncophora]
MATQGPSFNSRVRDYRRNLFGDGAPLVKQGFLGVRNQDITVRERRRYTDILREKQVGVLPKSSEHGTALQKAPSLSAIERIKGRYRESGSEVRREETPTEVTYAPIFVSRLRDVYLKKASFVVFECAVTGSPPPNVEWQFQEAPGRPGRPECDLVSDTEAMLSWEAPEGPTYLEGITYRLEYRNADVNDYLAPWVVISENVDDEAAAVRHLNPLGIYQFRVTAKNGFGYGLPSLISRLIQTNGRGAPKLPLDGMKEECRFNVLTLPQKRSAARQLEEISEESEEDHSRVEPCAPLELLAEDPTKRFQVGYE